MTGVQVGAAIVATRFVVAEVGAVPLALLRRRRCMPADVPLTSWAIVLAIGGSSAVGYYLWLWALSRERSTEVTMFLG